MELGDGEESRNPSVANGASVTVKVDANLHYRQSAKSKTRGIIL